MARTERTEHQRRVVTAESELRRLEGMKGRREDKLKDAGRKVQLAKERLERVREEKD